MLQSVPKIVALITIRANTGAPAYMVHNSWHMRYKLGAFTAFYGPIQFDSRGFMEPTIKILYIIGS